MTLTHVVPVKKLWHSQNRNEGVEMKSAKKYAQKVAHGAMVGRLSVAQNMYQDALDKLNMLAAENAALRKQISPFSQRDGRVQEGLIVKGLQAEGNQVRADAIERTKKDWVGLTDEEISAVDWKSNETLHDFARSIEAKLKEKSGG